MFDITTAIMNLARKNEKRTKKETMGSDRDDCGFSWEELNEGVFIFHDYL
jgi:hypothetical protein